MKIFIVSSGRPQRQITAKQFAPNTKYSVCTVVPESQQLDYLEYQDTGCYVFHDKQGIRATRQFLLDYCASNEKIVVLDDDLSFYKRKEDGSFIKANPNDVETMFDEIEMKLDQFCHVGVTDKFMSHLKPREYVMNGRYNQVLAYNLKKFPVPIPSYRVEVGEEQDFNLQLLNTGRESCILTEWSKSTTNYAPGGCSVWRTSEVELQAHRKMVELWPDIVTLRENKSTISKTSLSIQWRKAYVPNPDIHPFTVSRQPFD